MDKTETCEERHYACCEAFPPSKSAMTAEEYEDYYNAHVKAFAETPKA